MRDLLSSFYHVRTDAPEGMQATTCTSLEEFAKLLPHGSGFDGDWFISVRPKGKGFRLSTDWHAMNDVGYYVGWFPVTVILEREKGTGRLSVGAVRVNARGTNDAGDYIAESIQFACEEANRCH